MICIESVVHLVDMAIDTIHIAHIDGRRRVRTTYNFYICQVYGSE